MLAISSLITGNVVVVGDVHGCLKQLQTLLRKVNFRNKKYMSVIDKYNPQTLQSHQEEIRQSEALLKGDEWMQHEHKECHCNNNNNNNNDNEQTWLITSLPYKLTKYDLRTVREDYKSKPNPHVVNEDVCLFVGDLVNKGPYSFETVRFLRDIGAVGVLGNHEVKLLQLIHRKEKGTLTAHDKQSSLYSLAVDCPKDVREYLEALPFALCLPQFHCVIVHAAVDPSVTLTEQQPIVLTKARNLLSRHKYKKYIAKYELKPTNTNEQHNKHEQVMQKTNQKNQYNEEPEHEEQGYEISKERNTKMEEDQQSVESKSSSSSKNSKTALSISHYYAVMEKDEMGKAWASVWSERFTKFVKHHVKNSKKDSNVENMVNHAKSINRLNEGNTLIDSSKDDDGVKRKNNKFALCEELYSWCNNDALIIFGHDARRGLQRYEHAIGLDSGCVYGRQLSALVLPTRTIVSVNGWNDKHHKQHNEEKVNRESNKGAMYKKTSTIDTANMSSANNSQLGKL